MIRQKAKVIPDEILKKIYKYFCANYTYKEICHFLKKKHNINTSLSTLKRLLHFKGLRRYKAQMSPITKVTVAIAIELEGSACNLGYRSMRQRLQKVYGLTVHQKTVAKILKILDPEGVEKRRHHKLKRRVYKVSGPNHLWHADGHDKLKRYGFAIHACIDGFSRKLMWLKVATSNNNPNIISYYFLQKVKQCKFAPTILRTDKGTENVVMGDFQMALRFYHNDPQAGENSFLVGKSTQNQRIEHYWTQLLRMMGRYYMGFFRNMCFKGILNIQEPLHVECLRYCFGHLVQEELNVVMREWNEHYVRQQRARNLPGGRPNVMYHWPEKFGGVECKKDVSEEHVQILEENYLNDVPELYDPQFEELVMFLLPNVKKPVTAYDAGYLFCEILDKIDEYNELPGESAITH